MKFKFWPFDNPFYDFVVHDITNDGHVVHYSDGEVDICNEVRRFQGGSNNNTTFGNPLLSFGS